MEVYSTDSAEESEKERARKGTLGRIAERRFETMLRSLTGRRGELARCMTFALDHSDAVVQVKSILDFFWKPLTKKYLSWLISSLAH
jgi:U2-associated protein SR140